MHLYALNEFQFFTSMTIVVNSNLRFALEDIQAMILPEHMYVQNLEILDNIINLLDTLLKELRANIKLKFANKYTLVNQIIRVINTFTK